MDFYKQILFETFKKELDVLKVSHLSGGCINETLKVTTGEKEYCIKINEVSKFDMFLAEEKGLAVLQENSQFTIPKVYGTGTIEGKSFLVMEYIQGNKQSNNYWETLGSWLAELHTRSADGFGLDHNNYIGALQQNNNIHHDWISFFIENRIEKQLKLALNNQLADHGFLKRMRNIYHVFHDEFPVESPSLLHGDLWSGNIGTNDIGTPFIFDPAVYFGHREIEIAFTKLFGGFDDRFYQSYGEAFPLQPGFNQRMDLYNLYPLLVHLNLFGTSYLGSINLIINRYQ